jgi:hypothetical protein
MAEILPRHRRVVLWGFTESLDSFRHIYRHYFRTLARLDKECSWVPDSDESRDLIRAGDLVFAVDVESKHLGAPVEGADYLLHNVGADHPVWDGLAEERFVRLQVYTSDAEQYGVEWVPARRYDRAARTLFQPWGTDLLADEFYPPVFAFESREVYFVGSVWDDGGMGNANEIGELRRVVERRGLTLRHLYHVSDEENVIAVRASRFAPAISGRWQCEKNYLPCRVFKNVSYGALGVTNVPALRALLGGGWEIAGSLAARSITSHVDGVLALREQDYLDLVRDQQEVVRRYTYRESLEAIGRAFEEGR